jgi:hypothetical protein
VSSEAEKCLHRRPVAEVTSPLIAVALGTFVRRIIDR